MCVICVLHRRDAFLHFLYWLKKQTLSGRGFMGLIPWQQDNEEMSIAQAPIRFCFTSNTFCC